MHHRGCLLSRSNIYKSNPWVKIQIYSRQEISVILLEQRNRLHEMVPSQYLFVSSCMRQCIKKYWQHFLFTSFQYLRILWVMANKWYQSLLIFSLCINSFFNIYNCNFFWKMQINFKYFSKAWNLSPWAEILSFFHKLYCQILVSLAFNSSYKQACFFLCFKTTLANIFFFDKRQ